jgi:LysR family glycine cleavage system transcriptional activator
MAPLSHLNALRALEAAVRLGSFSAAGTELGVTPAAVGQQVRKLEESLGRSLLVRGANGFQATEAAHQAADHLATGFGELGQAMALLRGNTTRYRVSVSVVPTIAERWLAPRLPDFLGANPEIDLRIDSTHHVHYRAGDEYDFALRYDRPGTEDLSEIDLFREYLIPVCTPGVASRVRLQDGVAALARTPIIRVDRSTSDPDWIDWEDWGRRFEYAIPRPGQGLQFTFTNLALRAAYDGSGMHLAQLSITLPDILAGRMTAPFGPAMAAQTGYPYRLIVLNPARRDRLHRNFTDWIVAEAESTRAAMAAYLTG